MKLSIKRNIIYNVVIQCATLIVPFITTPYVSRVLGADNLGKYSFVMAMVTYFIIVSSFGSNIYGQRKVAFFRDDQKSVSQVFWNTFFFRLIMSLGALIIYVIYVATLKKWDIIYLIMSLHILNSLFDITWFFQGIEEFKNVGIRTILVRMISIVGIYILVKNPSDTWKYALIIGISYLLGSLSMWLMLFGKIQFVESVHPFDGFKDIVLIFLPSFATQIYMVLDKSMIGWITKSEYANGCYDMSEKIARLALTVVTSLGAVMVPRIANLYHHNDEGTIREYIYKSYRTVGMIGIPMMFGLMGVASVFIPLFLGKGYNDSIGLLIIFAMLVFLVGESYVIGTSYLVATEQQNVYTVTVTIAVIVNVVMNMALIPLIGAYGAAIASVCAEFVVLLLQILYCVRRKGFNASLFVRPLLKYFVSGIVMFSAVELVKSMLGSGILDLVICIFVGILVYICCLLVLKDDLFIYIFTKIMAMIKPKKNN